VDAHNVKMTELLINAGADVNMKNKRGETALMIAISYGHNDVVRTLLDAGAVKLGLIDINTGE